MQFFSSDELPITQSGPVMTFPRMNAPGRTSVLSPRMTKPSIVAVFDIFTFLPTRIVSPYFSNPSTPVSMRFLMKSFILGRMSHGYYVEAKTPASCSTSQSKSSLVCTFFLISTDLVSFLFQDGIDLFDIRVAKFFRLAFSHYPDERFRAAAA